MVAFSYVISEPPQRAFGLFTQGADASRVNNRKARRTIPLPTPKPPPPYFAFTAASSNFTDSTLDIPSAPMVIPYNIPARLIVSGLWVINTN